MQMASAPMGFNHFAPQFMGPPSVQMTPRQPEENVDPQEVDRRKKAHQEMLALHHDLLQSHTSLQKQHADLMKAHKELLQAFKNASFNAGGGAAGAAAAAKKMVKHPALGVVRLDYDYPPAPGDSDHPASFGYDVYFRCVPGLSFEMCQTGQFTEEVERRFADAIKHLEARGVSAITGDCGFMMAFQVLARKIAAKPIFMSSMVQCPIIAAALDPDDQIMVLTANEHSLKPQKEILMTSCGFDVEEHRFVIHGCQDVPGFEAVAKGEKVPLDIVQPGIIKMAMDLIQQNPMIRAILLECTELPPYADALRYHTGLPVWDAITAADFYVSAFQDNPRFGISDWQQEWDGEQEHYELGTHLTKDEMLLLQNKATHKKEKKQAALLHKKKLDKVQRKVRKQQAPILGVIRLDYNYPPAPGDIDFPGSYDYDGDSLKPQKETLLKQCGFNVDDRRFMIVGCQDVPGFDAVAKGEKVDVEYVTPGIVYMVKQILKQHASIRAICLECTELPPYADALRSETKLPVFDAITNADFFIAARRDNPRFGFNQWQLDWDGLQDNYEFGSNLTAEQAEKLLN